jgi:hypothetical protein
MYERFPPGRHWVKGHPNEDILLSAMQAMRTRKMCETTCNIPADIQALDAHTAPQLPLSCRKYLAHSLLGCIPSANSVILVSHSGSLR